MWSVGSHWCPVWHYESPPPYGPSSPKLGKPKDLTLNCGKTATDTLQLCIQTDCSNSLTRTSTRLSYWISSSLTFCAKISFVGLPNLVKISRRGNYHKWTIVMHDELTCRFGLTSFLCGTPKTTAGFAALPYSRRISGHPTSKSITGVSLLFDNFDSFVNCWAILLYYLCLGVL